METETNPIEILEGDITVYVADAIVIPATPRLQYHGIGIQQRIAKRGGTGIFYELEQVGTSYARAHYSQMKKWEKTVSKVPPCSAHLTNAGTLPPRYIIHAVAMDFDENGVYFSEQILRRTVQNSLHLAASRNFVSLGFCPLGDGSLQSRLEPIFVEEFRIALSKNTSIKKLALVFDK